MLRKRLHHNYLPCSATILGLFLSLTGLGCSETLLFDIIIYDPCNQPALEQAEHIEISIESYNGGGGEKKVVWEAKSNKGELEKIPTMNDAVVSVTGRISNSSGGPGAAVIASTIGLIDLTGKDGEELVEINVVTGKTSTFINTTDTGTANICTVQTYPRRDHTASLLPNGKVLIVGGANMVLDNGAPTPALLNSTELYNPVTGKYQTGPQITYQQQGHTATRLKDGRILIVGGEGIIDAQIATLGVASIYDPKKNNFSNTAMTNNRVGHSATLLNDGRVLIVGGRDGTTYLDSSGIFNPTDNKITIGPSIMVARAHHSAILVDDSTVAIIGGVDDSEVLSSVEFIKVSNNEVIEGPSLNQARSHFSAAMVPGEDTILIAGGFITPVVSIEYGTGIDNVELIHLYVGNYALSTVGCSNVTLNNARGAAPAISVNDKILIIGGVGSTGSEILATSELISFEDPEFCLLNIAETPPLLSTARAGAQLTPLIGGDILVTGGVTRDVDQISSVAQGEIFIHPRID